MNNPIETNYFNPDGSYAGKRVGDHIFSKWGDPILNVVGNDLIVVGTGELVGFVDDEVVTDYFGRHVAEGRQESNP